VNKDCQRTTWRMQRVLSTCLDQRAGLPGG